MELRNGTWTSQSKGDDARAIRRLAQQIAEQTNEASTREKADRIVRLARDLEREL